MDTELAAQSCDRQLDVQVETSGEWSSPQGLVLLLALLNIFAGGVDNGIECTLMKFLDNTKMNGTADILEGRDTIQMDLDRLEEWDCMNHKNFKKTNARSCTWDMSISNMSTGWRRSGLRVAQRKRT